MTTLVEKITSVKDQRFILPGHHTWQQFKQLQALMKEFPGVRISYLDGCVECMTVSEQHENIKSVLAILLALYFFEKGINFIPVGNATREAETKGASFEPDESYYIGQRKEHPDLAIEVVITSGGTDKLEKYKRFNITEVWFWDNQLSLYRLQENNYQPISSSTLLPQLNIELLVSCVLMPSILEARTEFMNGIRL